MNLTKLAFVVLLVHSQHQAAFATNLWFMPGDATFPVVLDKEVAEELRESKQELHLQYSTLNGGGYFCGHAGYHTLEIQDVPASWPEKIHEIYTELRIRSPRHLKQQRDPDDEVEQETNGFLMFVQNRNFDFDNYQVGFRYNEDWMDAFPAKGQPAKSLGLLYQPHYTHPADTIEDWANGKRVEGLRVQYPDPATEGLDKDESDDDPDEADESAGKPAKEQRNEFERHFGKGLMTGSAKDLVIVILPEENLEDHRSQHGARAASTFRQQHGTLIVLNAEGVWLHQRDQKGPHRATPWKRQNQAGPATEETTRKKLTDLGIAPTSAGPPARKSMVLKLGEQ